MKTIFAKIISVVSVAPMMSLILLSSLYFLGVPAFHDGTQILMALLFLTIFPISAYPLQKIIPPFKNQGREGQRNLAFILILIGYTLGMFWAILSHAPRPFFVVYFGYFLSAVILTIINKWAKVRASGHACGVMGPVILFINFLGSFSWVSFLLLPVVFWSRLKMGRHTLPELLYGASVSLVCTLFSLALLNFSF